MFALKLMLLAALVLLTQACIPPFNNFRYADNTTLLQEAVTQHESNPAMGWSHILNGQGPAEHWPTGADGIVHIEYCFANPESKEALGGIIIRSSELWRGALGNAGPGNEHRMGGFSEYSKNGNTPLCYKNGRWNDDVPVGTLVVMLFPKPQDGGGQASLGYRPSDWDAAPDRHQLRMGTPNPAIEPYFLRVAAHEMGHVMGLNHEHQRYDRDHFVHFECSNLIGYADAKALADASQGMTINKLCASSVFGWLPPYVETGFRPYSYATEDLYEISHKDKNGEYDGAKHPYSVTSDPEMYDYESLMHYSSFENFNGEKEKNVRGAPLVKWKNGAKDYDPPAEVTEENAEMLLYSAGRIGPTSKDVGIIKALYAWGA